jgi:hypothetical protein
LSYRGKKQECHWKRRKNRKIAIYTYGIKASEGTETDGIKGKENHHTYTGLVINLILKLDFEYSSFFQWNFLVQKSKFGLKIKSHLLHPHIIRLTEGHPIKSNPIPFIHSFIS